MLFLKVLLALNENKSMSQIVVKDNIICIKLSFVVCKVLSLLALRGNGLLQMVYNILLGD